jgi:hypothetical protein
VTTAVFTQDTRPRSAYKCELCGTPVLHGAVRHPQAGYCHFSCWWNWVFSKAHPERFTVNNTLKSKRSRK